MEQLANMASDGFSHFLAFTCMKELEMKQVDQREQHSSFSDVMERDLGSSSSVLCLATPLSTAVTVFFQKEFILKLSAATCHKTKDKYEKALKELDQTTPQYMENMEQLEQAIHFTNNFLTPGIAVAISKMAVFLSGKSSCC
ncbi:hypothetical protein A6R68_16579 [Neotoma lepida]|uniref:Uncharacterized protein n=1 Tax=Neotoma lepida TaxID=56216 RepID=A0A1A6HGA2_NEOLE|nr:hypothetical protein A6R68_16579 [Neotoma lepida]